MYEELLTDLKHCGSALSCGDCRIKCTAGCIETLMNRAADAIEELQDKNRALVLEVAETRQDADFANAAACELYAATAKCPEDAKCPHYIRNVHDRGDDSLCNKFECEVAALPKSGPMLKGG